VAEQRLIESSELPLERELLRAASAECAPLSVRRRALDALGLLRVMPPTASASASTSPSATSLRHYQWLLKLSLVVAIGVAIGAVAAMGSLWYESRRVPHGLPTTTSVNPNMVPAAPGSAPQPR
jgi:hypothetical protein